MTGRLRLVVLAGLALLLAAVVPAEAAAATSDQTRAAQQALTSLGYDPGPADGAAGRRTRQALRKFQRQISLPATGRLDDATLAALNIKEPPTADPVAAAPAEPVALAATGSASSGSGTGMFIVLFLAGGIAVVVWYSRRGKAAAVFAPLPQSTPIKRQIETPLSQQTSVKSRTAVSVQDVPAKQDWWKVRMPIEIDIVAAREPDTALERMEQARHAWVPAGQAATIAGYRISSGLVYVGAALARQDGLGSENCLINPGFAVSPDARNDDGAGMSYYPSYAGLDPASRASYLNWLATGKSDPDAYIGYVFLYFYGLERRLFLDDARADADAIVAEVRRLLAIYGGNHSFARYADALLDAAALRAGVAGPVPPAQLRKRIWELPLGLRAALGRQIAAGQPLSADQMLSWFCAHPDKRVPARLVVRCPEEFCKLFALRFAETYPQGWKVAPPARKLSATYKAASGSFSVALHGVFEDWPDVGGVTAPLNAVQTLVDACEAELEPYAQRAGRAADRREPLDVALALPPALRDAPAAEPLQALKQFVAKTWTSPAALLPLNDLAAAAGISSDGNGNYGKADMLRLARALGACGFGMEPDPRIDYSRMGFGDVAVLFEAKDADKEPAPGPQFLAAMLRIDLGAMVAAADGVFAPSEFAAIERELAANVELGGADRVRLLARVAYRMKKPVVPRSFRRLGERSLDERSALARFAVSVATADDRLAIEEVQLLEKLYKVLDLPEAQLYSDLQGLSASTADLPAAAKPDAAIPAAQAGAAVLRKSIQLDPGRLARTRAETAEVGALLGKIFVDDAPPATPTRVVAQASIVAKYDLDGLDPRYASLVCALGERASIDRAEFAELAHACDVLPDGAIEAVNDWAFGRFDQPLLDEGAAITIDRSLLHVSERASA